MVSRHRKGPPLPTGTVTFLFTDIEGSTRLWETQRSAMQQALARHDALLRQMIERHHGHVVKTTGDGALAAFASATDALEASIAAQQALGVEPWPGPVRIRVRMALHTGPAEFRDGDYFGPTLNRAARLLALGHGGQILVSAITHELCRDYLPPDVSLSSLGEHGLKDVDRREAVFELRHAALSQVFPPLRDLVAIGETIPSIAVLPFVNRSRDEEDEYFSDGLADELLNVLAKIRGLRVAARTSSFQFRGKNEDIAVIGRKLNVATVLEGAVRKAGNRMRISVQLVKVADGYQLWSEIYDRTLEDIFAVQDDIAQSVVKKLRTTLLGAAADSDASGEVMAEVSRAAKGRSTDPEAHRLYLLAQHLYDRASREDVRKAIEYLKEALARDAQFALAWEVLSRAYSREADLSWVPIADGYGRARAAVERALALEPDLAEGHAMLGFIKMNHDWDWRGAEVSYSRALELAPGHGLVIRRAGVLATVRGRLEEAIALYRRAVEQDPLSPYAYNNLGLALYAADRFAGAAAAYREALELAPQRVATHGYLALTLLAQGLREEAIEHAMREPHEAYRLWALAIIHHALGHRGESDAAVQMLIAKYRPGAPYQVAEVYAARGEGDLAFEWLELAYAQRDGGLAEMKSDPCLRSLHTDPRWNAFMSKMGLAD